MCCDSAIPCTVPGLLGAQLICETEVTLASPGMGSCAGTGHGFPCTVLGTVQSLPGIRGLLAVPEARVVQGGLWTESQMGLVRSTAPVDLLP